MKNKTRKNMIFWVLLAVMLVISGGSSGEKQGISLGGAQTVQAAAKYVVARFRNTSGKPSYNSLRIKVKSGSKIRLPAVPSVTGYQNLGWSTKKNATKATYAAGKKIQLKKNISLYAVRKKVGVYKVSFYNTNGSANSTFKALNKSVTRKAYLTLPSVPTKSGYESLGWSTS